MQSAAPAATNAAPASNPFAVPPTATPQPAAAAPLPPQAEPGAEPPRKKKLPSNSPLTVLEAAKRIDRIFRRLKPSQRAAVSTMMAEAAND